MQLATVVAGDGSESMILMLFTTPHQITLRITIPAGKGGKYLVIAQLVIAANSAGTRELWLQKWCCMCYSRYEAE
jgi:hypothetical protein